MTNKQTDKNTDSKVKAEVAAEITCITVTVAAFTWTQIIRPNPIKNASCKHINWKILIRFGPFRSKFYSKREGWFKLTLFPNGVMYTPIWIYNFSD